MKLVTFIFFFIFFFSLILFASNIKEPPWVYKGRGDRYYKNGEIGKAIVEYKKALNSNNNLTKPTKKNIYPEVNIKLSEIYLNEGLYDFALFQIEIAEHQKDYLQIPELIFNILYIKADIYYKQKKYNDAIVVYEEIVKNDNNLKEYFFENPYVIVGKYIDSPEHKKKYGKAYLEIGKIKYFLNNFDNAIPYLKMALLYRYEKDMALKYLVNCYVNLDNIVLAEKVRRVYRKK